MPPFLGRSFQPLGKASFAPNVGFQGQVHDWQRQASRSQMALVADVLRRLAHARVMANASPGWMPPTGPVNVPSFADDRDG